jgi:EmrB/QacA subfamily drug resistance transporter
MNSNPSSPVYRWAVLAIIMMGTLMAILDISIVNVALPHMMSAFGVNQNQIEWVATGFMLATAVSMPLVGWLISRLGHRTLYLGSLSLFTLGSAACAMAWSYDSLIVARIIQAVGGGAIQPVGMAIVAELFEPEERGKALGIWGTGIMIGPAVGPTLGGYLTEAFSWRAIFSVNLPFGLLTLLLGLAVIQSDSKRSGRKVPFDWWGFIFLSMAMIAGLLALSKGQEKGWTSEYIIICLGFTIIGLTMFITVEGVIAHPLLDLKLFLCRNFTLSMGLAIFRAVGMFGGIFLLPIFLEDLVGYTTIQTGLWMMPGALMVGVTMPVSGRMADRYSIRWLVLVGVVLTGISLILYGGLDPLSGAAMIIGPQLVRGVGLAFMMAPLLTAALNAVPPEQVATASSFLNVAQRVGGSFGIALLNTFVTNSLRVHSVHLGSLVGNSSESLSQWAEAGLRESHLKVQGLFMSADMKGMVSAVKTVLERANVLSFQNGFFLAGCIILMSVPLCLLLEERKHPRIDTAEKE